MRGDQRRKTPPSGSGEQSARDLGICYNLLRLTTSDSDHFDVHLSLIKYSTAGMRLTLVSYFANLRLGLMQIEIHVSILFCSR